MKELEYPFDPDYITKKKKSLKNRILSTKNNFIEKRIAILGGRQLKILKLYWNFFF